MKQLWIKLVSLALVLTTLLTTVLSGCAIIDPTGSLQPTETGVESETDDGTYGYEPAFLPLTTDLERADYNDKEITLLYRGPDQRMSHEVYIEGGDSNGNRVDYAVYQRNKQVEDYLGIKFKFVPVDGAAHGYELIKQLSAEIRAGNNTYQIVTNSNYGMSDSIMMGYFMNLKGAKNIDLSQKYWAQSINDNAEISNAIYGVTGSISLYMYQELFVCFFNKALAAQKGIDPRTVYQAVTDGNWTLDYLMELTKDVYSDINDNKYADPEDIFGLAIQLHSATNGFWSSCNIRMTSKDESGGVQLDLDVTRLYNVVSKLNSLVWDHRGVLRLVEGGEFENASSGFYNAQGSVLVGQDHAIFGTDRLYELGEEAIRNDPNIGVLPYPKYDQRQKYYYSCVHDSYSVYAIPITAREDADVCGAVLECMAVYNHNIVMPVYYREILGETKAPDPLVVQTLNIIFQNIKMDSGLIYFIGGLLSTMSGMLVSHTTNVSVLYGQMIVPVQSACRRINMLFANYAESNK